MIYSYERAIPLLMNSHGITKPSQFPRHAFVANVTPGYPIREFLLSSGRANLFPRAKSHEIPAGRNPLRVWGDFLKFKDAKYKPAKRSLSLSLFFSVFGIFSREEIWNHNKIC